MSHRMALCVALLFFVTPSSSLPPAVSQTRAIHPEIKRQQDWTYQSDFLQASKFRLHVVKTYGAKESVPSVHALSGRSEGSLPTVKTSSSKWMPMVATWYDARQGINGTGDGITASGARVQAGVTIAVDPKVIPLGSIVEVKFPDGKEHMYKAEDVGGAIKGDRIDIYNPSPQYCYQHGIEHVLVRIWHPNGTRNIAVSVHHGTGGAAA